MQVARQPYRGQGWLPRGQADMPGAVMIVWQPMSAKRLSPSSRSRPRSAHIFRRALEIFAVVISVWFALEFVNSTFGFGAATVLVLVLVAGGFLAIARLP